MKLFPALDLERSDDLVLAALDEYAPTAIEERSAGMRVFFSTPEQRDAARAQLAADQLNAVALDVSDEDWATRSQQNLTPVTVGRIAVVPSRSWGPALAGPSSGPPKGGPYTVVKNAVAPGPQPLFIVIEPSMGFGTGHHATTRLCLAALQNENLSGAFVLDVGTGSGILAIAATRLGAAQAYGIDFDPDAIQSASENLALNPEAHNVTFVVGDLLSVSLSRADIVVANLTGAVLIRSADSLIEAVRTGGTVIASGILVTEADEVRRAFGVAILLRREQEDEWVCLVMKKV